MFYWCDRFLFIVSAAHPGESHLEEERVGIVSQLAQQFGLRPRVDSLVAVLQRRIHLAGGQVKLPAERYPHHIHVISAVAEGAGQGDEHWRAEERHWFDAQDTLIKHFLHICKMYRLIHIYDTLCPARRDRCAVEVWASNERNMRWTVSTSCNIADTDLSSPAEPRDQWGWRHLVVENKKVKALKVMKLKLNWV